MFSFWLWSSTQHNIFTESIGYAVAIETIHILRCVWKASHTHTDTQSHCTDSHTIPTGESILEHGVQQLFVLFIYLLNYLCFTFIGVPQVYSRGLGRMELNQKKWTVT